MAVLKEKQEVNNMEEEDRQRELDKKEEKKRRRAQKAAENAALLEEAAAEEEYKAEARARIGAFPFAARLRPCLSSQLVSSVLPSLGVHFFPFGNARRNRWQSGGHGQSDSVGIVHRQGQLS